MAIKLGEEDGGRILDVSLSGKLAKEDYETFVPVVERLVKQHGKIRMLVDMHDFHGWTVGAMWEDTKFDAHHFSDIERLAMVGEKAWEKGMSVFCRPFTTAKIRYFDKSQAAEAHAWVSRN